METKNAYEPNFEEVLRFCEKKHLYLGLGNPNAKILIVNKEFHCKEKEYPNKEHPANEQNNEKIKIAVENKEKEEVNRNLKEWREKKRIPIIDDCPTWKNCRELIGFIDEDKKDDFSAHCFTTEMSQIPLPKSSWLPKDLDSLREKSIAQRKELFAQPEKLFAQPFFRKFPIVILACGHYPRDYNFNIQDIFKINMIGETQRVPKVSKFWYNVHKDGSSRILIHTRQLSNFFSKDNGESLLTAIADQCKSYYKNP
jgi:hypothetical protein